MEITLNVNINAPALVDILKQAMAMPAGGISTKPAFPTTAETPKPPKFLEKEIAAQNGAAATSAVAPVADEKPARKTRGKADTAAPAPVANGATPEVNSLGAARVEAGLPAELKAAREVVKARLSDYSADKRFGMDGVFALLKKYGVERVSDVEEAEMIAFKQEIDNALAAKADPLS